MDCLFNCLTAISRGEYLYLSRLTATTMKMEVLARVFTIRGYLIGTSSLFLLSEVGTRSYAHIALLRFSKRPLALLSVKKNDRAETAKVPTSLQAVEPFTKTVKVCN